MGASALQRGEILITNMLYLLIYINEKNLFLVVQNALISTMLIG